MNTSLRFIFLHLLCLIIATANAASDDGYVYYQNLGVHYKLHKTPKKWLDAKVQCSMEKATLAMPTNEDEAVVLTQLLNSIRGTDAAKNVDADNLLLNFHDLFNEGEFVTDKGTPLQYFFHSFLTGQPDNWKGSENCGTITNGGKLNDVSCDADKIFACQKEDVTYESQLYSNLCPNSDREYKLEPVSGKYFKLHMHPKTWNDARSICQAEGGKLAMIGSKQEEDFLVNAFNNPQNRVNPGCRDYAFLGFHDFYREGQFYTISGEELSKTNYVRWGQGQPDNHRGEQCGSMTSSGALNDLNCSAKTVFFCEKIFTRNNDISPVDVRFDSGNDTFH